MMEEQSLFKAALLSWTYSVLNSEFPRYFNTDSYINLDGIKVNNSPNVYWADSVRDRPVDATECYLDIVSDESVSFGSDGDFYQDLQDNKWYYKLTETHEVIVRFSIASMKNKKLELSALQAENLVYNAISYLRLLLKSGSASDYFCYENQYYTPILVCSQHRNLSEITNVSVFEDTRNRYTNQFTCKFSYDVISKREVDLAQNIYNIVEYAKDANIEFYTKNNNS